MKALGLFSWEGLTPSKAEQTVYWFMYGKRWEPCRYSTCGIW